MTHQFEFIVQSANFSGLGVVNTNSENVTMISVQYTTARPNTSFVSTIREAETFTHRYTLRINVVISGNFSTQGIG